MRISDWSSDVCASDPGARHANAADRSADLPLPCLCGASYTDWQQELMESNEPRPGSGIRKPQLDVDPAMPADPNNVVCFGGQVRGMTTWSWKTRRASIASNHLVRCGRTPLRSEEHTSELQSLMRISYAVFCLQKNKQKHILQ